MIAILLVTAFVLLCCALGYRRFRSKITDRNTDMIVHSNEVEYNLPEGTRAEVIDIPKGCIRYNRRGVYVGRIITLAAPGMWFIDDTGVPHPIHCWTLKLK